MVSFQIPKRSGKLTEHLRDYQIFKKDLHHITRLKFCEAVL